MSSYNDPFDALFALQRALDARLASDWMGAGTAARGSYPPVNVFQQGSSTTGGRARQEDALQERGSHILMC
jgi:hypothetical protein